MPVSSSHGRDGRFLSSLMWPRLLLVDAPSPRSPRLISIQLLFCFFLLSFASRSSPSLQRCTGLFCREQGCARVPCQPFAGYLVVRCRSSRALVAPRGGQRFELLFAGYEFPHPGPPSSPFFVLSSFPHFISSVWCQFNDLNGRSARRGFSHSTFASSPTSSACQLLFYGTPAMLLITSGIQLVAGGLCPTGIWWTVLISGARVCRKLLELSPLGRASIVSAMR